MPDGHASTSFEDMGRISPTGGPLREAWPLRTAHPPCLTWKRAFPGELTRLAGMRRWIADLLPECDARDVVVLVASELGANAVRHTASGLPGGWFAVAVTWTAGAVRVEVGDGGGPSVPEVIEDADGEDGRGLRLVAGLAGSLEVSGDEEGRLVRADIPWAADGGPPPQDCGYGPAVALALDSLQNAYPAAVIWFGQATGRWWALAGAGHGGRLLEGRSPGGLAAALAGLYPAVPSRRARGELALTRPQAVRGAAPASRPRGETW